VAAFYLLLVGAVNSLFVLFLKKYEAGDRIREKCVSCFCGSSGLVGIATVAAARMPGFVDFEGDR
jgi:hypothetical protein